MCGTNNTSRRAKRIFLAVVAASVSTLILLAYSAAMARGRSNEAAHYEAPAVAPAAAQEGNPAERPDVELITIGPAGFEPAEISRADGQFLLAVENRSGLEDLELHVSKRHGERLRETRFSGRLLDWRGVLSLPPGEYVITEANHPDWRCRITIGN
jgi:hypothetical protein